MNKTKKILFNLAVALLLAVVPQTAWARGGGGCLEEGTPVETPEGPRRIETLKENDTILTVSDHGLTKEKVLFLYSSLSEDVFKITANSAQGRYTVHATGEHPFALVNGDFREAHALVVGDRVVVAGKLSTEEAVVAQVEKEQGERKIFNLLVSGGKYIASGFLVHNKGCFLPNTMLTLANDEKKPIADIRPGDLVLAFDEDGKIVQAEVRNTITRTVDSYYVVTTSKVAVNVTAEHPFFVGNNTFRPVHSLHKGDYIYAYDGTGLSSQEILNIELISSPTTVYNLQTDKPNTFFANGIAVHNKGGGGFHGGSHGGGTPICGGPGQRKCNWKDFLPFFIFLAVFLPLFIVGLMNKQNRLNQNLDYCFPRQVINKKAETTRSLLEFISRQDPRWKEESLKQTAESCFIILQQCWEKRDYSRMQPLMMEHLYTQHCRQLESLKRNHEINLVGQPTIHSTDIVHLRYTDKPNERQFTALFTAEVHDYYVDDRNMRFLRGDTKSEKFQEFWTFFLQDGRWLLGDIEQTRESDALANENFFEQFTDTQVENATGHAVDETGPIGPWLSKGEDTKETKIERLLNFLYENDKLWNKEQMIRRAREVFSRVYLAIESGSISEDVEQLVFPELASYLKTQLDQWKQSGTSIELRNFCVRKAELALVRNYSNNSQDEFLTLINYHAQKIAKTNGTPTREDAYVTPYSEYWTFGRLDNQWKLKEIVPEKRGQELAKEDNLDEDSSKTELEWYYTKKRTV